MNWKKAKVFMNGRSQAVRLPKEFRFDTPEVLIRREGEKVILFPKPVGWDAFFDETPLPSEDFMEDRVDLPPQHREGLF